MLSRVGSVLRPTLPSKESDRFVVVWLWNIFCKGSYRQLVLPTGGNCIPNSILFHYKSRRLARRLYLTRATMTIV